jgi:predicted PurR-regulated permease PerM
MGVIALFVLVIVDSIHTFTTVYFRVYAARWDAVSAEALAWVRANLSFDASSLRTSLAAVLAQVSASSALASILSAAVVVVVTLLFTVFLLLDERLDGALIAGSFGGGGALAVRPRSAEERMWAEIDAAIHRYLLAKTLVSVAMGLAVFVVLGPVLHVKLAHLWGVLTVLFNFVPNVGALLAALLPLPIILLDADLSVAAQVAAIALPLALHVAIGNFVEPCVLGPLLSLHPVAVLVCLSFWWVLWGVPGAVLAVPITSVFAIALKGSKHAYADFIVTLLEECRIDLQLLADSGGGGGRRAGADAADDDPSDAGATDAPQQAAQKQRLRLRAPNVPVA